MGTSRHIKKFKGGRIPFCDIIKSQTVFLSKNSFMLRIKFHFWKLHTVCDLIMSQTVKPLDSFWQLLRVRRITAENRGIVSLYKACAIKVIKSWGRRPTHMIHNAFNGKTPCIYSARNNTTHRMKLLRRKDTEGSADKFS